MSAELRVGTSGYSFRDWVGIVYPDGTPASGFLEAYADDFDTVEINTTYYRIPEPTLFERMLTKVPESFEFVVKVPRELTHRRTRMEHAVSPFLEALKPLQTAHQLGGLLVQFPQSFHPNHTSIEYLKRVADRLSSDDYSVHIEFRHRDWIQPSVLDFLRSHALGFVNVDLPRLRSLPSPTSFTTTDVAYHRLHGRNREMWHGPPAGSYRYDYLYNDSELDEWAERIQETAGSARKVYVFGNNCHKGSSFVDALRLKQRLGLEIREDAHSQPDLFAVGHRMGRIEELLANVSRAREAEQPILERLLHERDRTL